MPIAVSSIRLKRALSLLLLISLAPLFALPVANDDSFTTDEDEPLTISGGGIILDANFESGSSVLGDTWLYFDKIENENGALHNYPIDGSANTWNSVAFDEATSTIGSWSAGTAPLQGGLIEAFPPGTPNVLGGIAAATNGENLITTYLFRQTFTLTAQQAIEADWILENIIDDGGIVYLNGAEIYRTPTMPLGAVTTTTLSAVGDELTPISTTIDLSGKLVEGINTIAVEVHQTTSTSSDVGFRLNLLSASASATGGFTYFDDAFNGTTQPNFATGNIDPTGGFTGAGLFVQAGNRPIGSQATSGGWSKQFILDSPATATINFRYRLTFDNGYENDEYGEALFEVDGVRYGNDVENSLTRFRGDGNGGGGTDDSGWQFASFDIPLTAGEHTMVLGSHSSKSTANGEVTSTWFDDIQISTPTTGGGVLLNDTGDSPTSIIQSSPAHGNVNLNPDGTFTYQPSLNYFGPDSFTYLARDNSGDSNIATVSITVNPLNDPPIAIADTIAGNEGVLTSIAAPGVLANDTDLEDDSLTAILVNNVSNGTLNLNSNGSFTYTPRNGFFGTDSFTYSTNDGANDSAPVSVTLEIAAINDPPVAVDDSYTTIENSPISVSVTSGIDQIIFSSDFNGATVPAEISGPGTLASVEGYDGLGPAGNTYSGQFLRNAATGNPATATTLTLFDLPPHQSISIRFLLSIIDSWEGNNDRFTVTLDGEDVFSNTFRNNNVGQGYPYPTGTLIFRNQEAAASSGTNALRDSGYDMSREPSLRDIPHTASTATITFFASGNNWDGGDDESWAIDNLEVMVSPAPVESLVAAGATWSYLDDGSDQGTAWREVSFDDDAWASGPAQLGYGDGDEATEVSFGGDSQNTHITTYFRHTFTLRDHDQFATLVTGLVRDDGAAVYLNGTLIALSNLEPDATFSTLAGGNPGFTGEATWSEFPVPPGLLREGTNVLAVEIHQDNSSSSDISMDAYLRGKRVTNPGIIANDTDPEDDELTAQLLTGPSNGTLQLNSNGTFLYIPNVNYEGPDFFTYRVRDGEFNSPPATVSLIMTSGLSDFPLTQPDSYPANEDTALLIPANTGLLSNDTDPDSPVLSVLVDTGPSNGTLSLSQLGSFTYTPNQNFFGTDTFTYRASDGDNLSRSQLVTINVAPVNDPPLASPENYLTAPGQTLTVTPSNGVLSNDTDPDNPGLTATVDSTTTSGTLNLAPNGSFTYTPNGGFSGLDSFTYQSFDGVLGSESVTVEIQVNAPPLAVNDSYSVTEDNPLIIEVESGLVDNDVDTDSLTVILVSEPAFGRLSLNLDGSFIYLPDGDFEGSDSFTYRATDFLQQSNLATVSIDVTGNNDPPTGRDDAYEVEFDQFLSIDATQGILTNDSDSDSTGITATLITDVSNGTLSLQPNGSFTYQSAPGFTGTDSFIYQANDGISQSGATEVEIEIYPSSRNIVINEIMYNPSSGSDLDEFIELTNIGTTPVSLDGWEFTMGVNFTFPAFTLFPGEFLVVAADSTTFETTYGALPNVLGGWTGKLSNSSEHIKLVNQSGDQVDEVSYFDQGDWGIRQRTTVNGEQGWSWTSDADGLGSSLELINPALPNNQGQNWIASQNTTPTPAMANSTTLDETAPLILDVEHFPKIPTSSDPIGITAELRGEFGQAIGGTLYYRVSAQNPGPFQTSPMFDDGHHRDAEANDGIFGFMLPPSPNGTVYEFYIESSDGTNTRTWPAPASNGQTANALLQVDDEANNIDHGFYRLILPVSEYNQWQGINRGSNAMMNATLILDDGTGPKVRYLAGVRVRGAGSRSHTPPPMRVAIPRDKEWNNMTRMNLNTKFTYLQFLGMKLFQASGMRAPDTYRIQVRINGRNISLGDDFDYGSMVHVQPLAGEFLDDKFETDRDGNLYKMARPDRDWVWRDGDIGNYESDGWIKQSNSSENDWSDLDELLRVMNNATDDPDYLTQVEAVADVDQWMRWFAAMAILANGETNISNGADDDYSIYRGAGNPRFVFIPHDLDTILSIGDNSRNEDPTHTLFDMIEDEDVLDPLVPFFSNPQIIDRYFQAIRELLQTSFSKAEFDELLDNNLTGWVPNNRIEQMRAFMDARRLFIEEQITPVIGPPNAATPATSEGTLESSHWPLYISEVLAINNSTLPVDGSYPDLIELHNSGPGAISLDGMSLSDDSSEPRRFVFPPGTSIPSNGYLVIRGGQALATPGIYTGFNLDGQGEALALYDTVANGQSVIDSVTFGMQLADYSIGRTGPGTTTWELCQPTLGGANMGLTLGDPSGLRINEWMTQPDEIFEEEFVEIYNPSTLPVALGSLIISDDPVNFPAKHRIPSLSFVAPQSFTLLTPLGADANPVRANQLPFKLASENEWIALIGSNNVFIDQVHFVNQPTDLSRGRIPNGSINYEDFLVPTPGYSNTAPLYNETLVLQNLRISEIMYDPIGGSDLEYIELENIGDESLNLAGIRFTGGIGFDFPNMILNPNEFVLVVRDYDAFSAFYGNGLNVAGEYSGKLSNGGERLRLEIEILNAGIHDFEYDDWFRAADGAGFSMNFNDTSLSPTAWSQKENWAPSLSINGSPGEVGTFSLLTDATEKITLPNELTITPHITFGPFSPASISYQWESLDGPAPIIFSDPIQSTATLSFTQPGIYTVRLTALAFGFEESQEITINVYDGYSDWVIRNFGSETPGLIGKTDDADSDGIDNLGEFALLMDPTDNDSHLFPTPVFDTTEQALTVTFSKNFLDPSRFAVVAEVSSDLKSWSSNPSNVSTEILSDNFGVQTIRAIDLTTANGTQFRFMRLRTICLDGIAANDAPRILSIENAPELPTITSTSIFGQQYQLQTLADPNEGWSPLGTPITASSEQITFTDTSSSITRARLYRVVRLASN